MPYPICVVDGISPGIAKKLLAAKIRTTTKLLQAAGSPQGRRVLAEKTGLDAATILRCANMADRMRIKGVGREHGHARAGKTFGQDLQRNRLASTGGSGSKTMPIGKPEGEVFRLRAFAYEQLAVLIRVHCKISSLPSTLSIRRL